MKTVTQAMACIALLFLTSWSKDDDKTPTTDVKSRFTGNWSGQQQIVGASVPYAFDLNIYENNTVKNIDLAFGSQEFPGSYTNDSLKINYNNDTRWKLKFSNNYTGCSGIVLGTQEARGTVSMSKN